MRYSSYYAAGAAMGFTPDQVRAMSLYDFHAAYAGFRTFHGSEDDAGAALTTAEELALAKAIDRPLLWN